MSATKAVGNILEQLLKKAPKEITGENISTVLKGASKGKDGYSVSHATSKLEGLFGEGADRKALEEGYSDFFVRDVDLKQYKAFTGSDKGYSEGMQTILDHEGRASGIFATQGLKKNIVGSVQSNRKNKTYAYQEDSNYAYGGRQLLREQNLTDAHYAKQREMYNLKESGTLKGNGKDMPAPLTRGEEAILKLPRGKKAQTKRKSTLEYREAKKRRKSINSYKNKSARSQKKDLESVSTYGEVKKETSNGVDYYTNPNQKGARYKSELGAKKDLAKAEKKNIDKYGKGYYDEGLNQRAMRPIVERAAEAGFKNTQTGLQKQKGLQDRLTKLQGTGLDDEAINKQLFAGDSGKTNKEILNASPEQLEGQIYSNYGGNGTLDSEDLFVKRVKGIERATANNKSLDLNKSKMDEIEKAGYNRENVIEFIQSKGHQEGDAYSVLNLKEKKGGVAELQYRHDIPSQRTRARSDGSTTYTSGDVRMEGQKDLSQNIVSERNKRANSILNDDPGATVGSAPRTEATSPGVGSTPHVEAEWTEPVAAAKNVDYVDTKEYSNTFTKLMENQPPPAVVGGLVGGAGTGMFSWDSNQSFESNMGRVGQNALIGSVGGSIGAKAGTAVFNAGSRRGGVGSNLMTMADTYVRHNPGSVLEEPLSAFASQRGNMYGKMGSNSTSGKMDRLASAGRASMYSGIGLGSAAGLSTFGQSGNNKSTGLNQKRGNKF
tara:strand:- start:6363 stop:8516 length:2154 start_codon:yes stop_codon:yes gene_type:complete